MELSILSLPWKLGLNPSTLSRSSTITRSLQNRYQWDQLHGIRGTICWVIVVICNLYMYYGQMELSLLSLPWKLGWTVIICY
jgi:hypothetical protein